MRLQETHLNLNEYMVKVEGNFGKFNKYVKTVMQELKASWQVVIKADRGYKANQTVTSKTITSARRARSGKVQHRFKIKSKNWCD